MRSFKAIISTLKKTSNFVLVVSTVLVPHVCHGDPGKVSAQPVPARSEVLKLKTDSRWKKLRMQFTSPLFQKTEKLVKNQADIELCEAFAKLIRLQPPTLKGMAVSLERLRQEGEAMLKQSANETRGKGIAQVTHACIVFAPGADRPAQVRGHVEFHLKSIGSLPGSWRHYIWCASDEEVQAARVAARSSKADVHVMKIADMEGGLAGGRIYNHALKNRFYKEAMVVAGLEAVYRFGGVYVTPGVRFRENFGSLPGKCDLILAADEYNLSSDMLAAKAGHPLLHSLLVTLAENLDSLDCKVRTDLRGVKQELELFCARGLLNMFLLHAWRGDLGRCLLLNRNNRYLDAGVYSSVKKRSAVTLYPVPPSIFSLHNSLFTVPISYDQNDSVYRFDPKLFKIHFPDSRINTQAQWLSQPSGLNPVPRKTPLIVSLTSWPPRIRYVWLAIESIMRQTVKPDRIILWLAEEEFLNKELPWTLEMLKKRGLEVRYCANLFGGKKLIPALKEFPEAVIVTVDDDQIYHANFLQDLYNCHLEDPSAIWSNNTLAITYDKLNRLHPYSSWLSLEGLLIAYKSVGAFKYVLKSLPGWVKRALLADEKKRWFPIGVCGVLYPPHSLHPKVLDHETYMKISAKNDDVWFYAMGVLQNSKVKLCKVFELNHIKSHKIDNSALSLTCNASGLTNSDMDKVFSLFGIYEKLKVNGPRWKIPLSSRVAQFARNNTSYELCEAFAKIAGCEPINLELITATFEQLAHESERILEQDAPVDANKGLGGVTHTCIVLAPGNERPVQVRRHVELHLDNISCLPEGWRHYIWCSEDEEAEAARVVVRSRNADVHVLKIPDMKGGFAGGRIYAHALRNGLHTEAMVLAGMGAVYRFGGVYMSPAVRLRDGFGTLAGRCDYISVMDGCGVSPDFFAAKAGHALFHSLLVTLEQGLDRLDAKVRSDLRGVKQELELFCGKGFMNMFLLQAAAGRLGRCLILDKDGEFADARDHHTAGKQFPVASYPPPPSIFSLHNSLFKTPIHYGRGDPAYRFDPKLFKKYFPGSGVETQEQWLSKPSGLNPLARKTPLIVSLTSWPPRIRYVWLTIESMMRQTVKPDRIILWLSEEEFLNKELPWTLEMLKRRGLEVRYCTNLFGAKKLIPTLKEFPEAVIVTVDDDGCYSPDMLAKLYESYQSSPDKVHAFNVAYITSKDGRINDCGHWIWNSGSRQDPEEESVRDTIKFPIGNFGVLYPPYALDKDVTDETAFLSLSAKNDDAWFFTMAVLKGTTAVHCTGEVPQPVEVLSNMRSALFVTCNIYNITERDIRNVFTHYGIYEKLGITKPY